MDESREERPVSLAEDGDSGAVDVDDALLFQLIRPLVSTCLSVNHDINNWLSGIFGYAEFLQTEADSLTDAERNYLDRIIQCAERIQLQINNISAIKSTLAARVDMDFLVEKIKSK